MAYDRLRPPGRGGPWRGNDAARTTKGMDEGGRWRLTVAMEVDDRDGLQ